MRTIMTRSAQKKQASEAQTRNHRAPAHSRKTITKPAKLVVPAETRIATRMMTRLSAANSANGSAKSLKHVATKAKNTPPKKVPAAKEIPKTFRKVMSRLLSPVKEACDINPESSVSSKQTPPHKRLPCQIAAMKDSVDLQSRDSTSFDA